MVDWQQKLAQLQRVTITPGQLQNQQITLNNEQQHYLGRVLRLRAGDRFIAMDGQGQWWLAQLQLGEGQAQVLEIISRQTELPVPVTLIAAPPKGNSFDEIVRQATELGVTTIVPVLSDRTLVNPSCQKLARWRRIAQEAAEQSERQVVPQVLEPRPFKDTLLQGDRDWQRYFCVTRHPSPHLLHCLQAARQSRILVLIGPEGGWTEAEVHQAIATGYQPVSLGCRVLRAATASLTALSLIAATLDSSRGILGSGGIVQ